MNEKPNTPPAEPPKPATPKPQTAQERGRELAELMIRNLNDATRDKPPAPEPSKPPA